MHQWIAFSLLLISSLILSLPVSAAVSSCDAPIKFGALTWESGQFTTGVLKYITENGYGCQVTEVPGAGPALENALLQDDIQVIGEQWIGRSPILEQAIEDKKVAIIGDTLEGGATQGWYVPKYVLEENPGLCRYQDLPKYAELFKDPEDPSKLRFMNCPSGWACEIFNTRLLKNTGLDKTFNSVHPGTGAALDAEISSAFEQHKPLLFYYWQPTGLMAKYDFVPLEFPAHDDACWQDLLIADGTSDCISGFPVSPLSIAVSTPFIQSNPELTDFFKQVKFTPDQLNGAILEMNENKRSGDEQALVFLRQNPDIWQTWITPEAAQKMAATLGMSLNGSALLNNAVSDRLENNNTPNLFSVSSSFPAWSLETSLNNVLATVVRNYGDVFRSVSSAALTYLLLPIERFLTFMPPWLIITLVTVLAWFGVRKIWFALACGVGLFLIGAFGLWGALIDTFALLIRLTTLGITQVNHEMVEAGRSFGSTHLQLLIWIKLPQALPSIMAGINQAVMMSLSMVVLASMIGAPGLGEDVLQSIQTLNIGQGLQAGTAIVIVAIIIDRITQAFGQGKRARQKTIDAGRRPIG